MTRRRIQAGTLFIATILLVGLGAAARHRAPATPENWTFSVSYGDVTWSHDLHARMSGSTCVSCHHNERQGMVDPTPCLDCHERLGAPEKTIVEHHKPSPALGKAQNAAAAPPAMIALHGSCIGCHKAKDKGPRACGECHAAAILPDGPAPAEKLTSADGPEKSLLSQLSKEYLPVVFAHKAHVDYADGCADCHHRHSSVESTPACRACHTEAETVPGSKTPGLKDAYHGQCIGCHEKNGSGPDKNACLVCHAKRDPAAVLKAVSGPDAARLAQLSTVYEGVAFNHASHLRVAESCQICHHKSNPVEPTPACRECHTTPLTVKGEPRLGLIDAYHSQCLTCHIKEGAGPVSCNGCHLKRSAAPHKEAPPSDAAAPPEAN